MAKLSIIIPVYNMKEQERQCLLSIRQTVRLPYEIIVVDDGSSADERISDAGTADNVRILHSDEHRGFSHAVNMGIPSERSFSFFMRLLGSLRIQWRICSMR